MENESTPRKSSIWAAMWNGLKKPLICASIMLVAAIALIALQDRKTTYDKNQNATYQLLGDAGLTPSEDVRAMAVRDFAKAVASRVSPDGRHLPFGVDSLRVIKKSSEEASTQSFKTPLELSIKLAESINRQKNEKLKMRHDELNKAIEAEIDNANLSSRVLDSLKAKAADEKLEVSGLLKDPDVGPALRGRKDITSVKLVPLATVSQTVKSFYVEKGTELTKQRETISYRIDETEESFQRLIAAVNSVLYEQTQPPAKDATGESHKRLLSGPTSTTNPTLALILDDKQGLVGVYWLLRVALTGAVLFAFLYLILIPLKHLFFWSASGDVLTDYTKKLLEAKASAVAPTVARAAIVTVAAATVAGSAALVANGLPFSPGAPAASPDEIAAKVGAKIKPPDVTGVPTDAPDDTEGRPEDSRVDPVVTSLNDLASRIATLEATVKGVNHTVEAPGFIDAVGNINRLLGSSDGSDPASVFGKLKELERLPTTLDPKFKGVRDLIGDDSQAIDQASLFGRMKRLSDSIGTRRTLAAGPDSTSSDLSVIESLRSLGTSASTDNSTLFGKTNSMMQSVSKVSETTGSIRRDQLGTGGRNFFTQSRTLFSSERYRISQSAYEEISRSLNWGDNDVLRNKLKSLVSDDRMYSEKELRVAMGPLLPGVWNDVKSQIIRFARVARY